MFTRLTEAESIQAKAERGLWGVSMGRGRSAGRPKSKCKWGMEGERGADSREERGARSHLAQGLWAERQTGVRQRQGTGGTTEN